MLNARQQHCLKGIGIRQWVQRPAMRRITAAPETATESAVLAETIIPATTSTVKPAGRISADIEFNADSWNDINRAIHQCQNCDLASNCTQKVPGVGSLQADLMIIGEGPGHDEDLTGEPFVGRSGRLLDKILQSIGISRPQVFITNIVKCRPPHNRDPHKDEVKACDAFLRAQIKYIAPKIILSVGRVSAQSLLDTNDPVGKLITQNHRLADSNIPVKVTYHPAYLLRNPAAKATVWQDMKMLQRILKP